VEWTGTDGEPDWTKDPVFQDIVWVTKGMWGSRQYISEIGEMPISSGPVPSIMGGVRCAFNGEITTYEHFTIPKAKDKEPNYTASIDPDGRRTHGLFGHGDPAAATFWRFGEPLSGVLLEEGVTGDWEGSGQEVRYHVTFGKGSRFEGQEIWIDPAQGFNIVRTRKSGYERRVDLSTVAPGIWFLKRLTALYAPQNLAVRFDTTKIEINKEIPEEFFLLKFTPGAWVTDNRTGSHRGFYAGMSDDERTALAADLAAEVREQTTQETEPTQPTRPTIGDIPAEPPAPTAGESNTLELLIAAVVALVLVLAALLAMKRMKRKRGQPDRDGPADDQT